ncbi:MAG: RNA polymerase sigma factor [Proteobacteria bacterium]|nr:RNA polymerase sigma factor [Pseudomonadota bacterium]
MQPDLQSDPLQFSRRWRPALMSFFLRRVRHHQEAEDLTQEVFARLICRESAQAPLGDAYIFQIAANLLRDGARRWKVREEYRLMSSGLEDSTPDSLDPARIVTGRAALSSIVAALETLPERTRTIFVLYRLEGVSMDVIANSFGISKSAVKKHVMRAMASLIARKRESE